MRFPWYAAGFWLIGTVQFTQDAWAADVSRSPKLRNPQDLISGSDYPRSSARRNETGIVSVQIEVSPKGRVDACEITESSGFETLDAVTCSLMRSRARFDPALDLAGSPVAGVYRLASTWGVDERQPTTNIILPLQVSVIPVGYRSPVRARLIFDATGHVTACEVTATSGSDAADRAVCEYVEHQLVITPPKAKISGVVPIAVRYLTASLSTEASKPAAK